MDFSLIFLVRQYLGEIPDEYLDDETIQNALDYADTYLSQVLPTNVDVEYRKKCQVTLAAYVAFISYISVVERGLGAIPGSAEWKARLLKEMALSLIRAVSPYDIADDFSVAKGAGVRVVIGKLTPTMIE